MRITDFAFGTISIDGTAYAHDVVVDRGKLRKRKKGPSKAYRGDYGHTPLSLAEQIPWKCKRLIVGSGADGMLPVLDEVRREAKRRGVKLVVVPTPEAVVILEEARDANAILHVTC